MIWCSRRRWQGRVEAHFGFAEGAGDVRLGRGTLLRQDEVSGSFRWGLLGDLVAKAGQVDARQEVLATTEEDGRDHEMHGVDQPGLQILANRRHTSSQARVAPGRGLSRSGQRLTGAAGDEVEGRPAPPPRGTRRSAAHGAPLSQSRRVLLSGSA